MRAALPVWYTKRRKEEGFYPVHVLEGVLGQTHLTESRDCSPVSCPRGGLLGFEEGAAGCG